MIKKRKQQFVIVLILACVSELVFGTEPNQPEAELKLKFEIRSEEQPWLISKGSGRGPIRPSHVAVLFIGPFRNFPDFEGPAAIRSIRSILSTSAGKSLSQQQADLVSTGPGCFARLGGFGEAVPNFYHFRLYAVREEDARKLAEAFIEVLTDDANEKARPNREAILELEDKISQTIAKIPEAEAEAQTALSKLKELKKTIHYASSDEAKSTISELNKMLVMNDVEIAGIEAKIREIEKYKSYKIVTEKTHLAVLEQMLSEQNIELAAALAKKKAAVAARDEAEVFCRLEEATKMPDYLTQQLRQYETNLRQTENMLDSNPDMIPPIIFQNKVTVYPVRAE